MTAARPIRVAMLVAALAVAVTAGAALRLIPHSRPAAASHHVRFEERRLPMAFYGSAVTAVALGPGGRAAVGTARGDVVLLDLRDGDRAVASERVARPAEISDLAFSADGHALAAATRGGVVQTWRQLPEGIYYSWWSWSDQTTFAALALNEDGTRLAVATSLAEFVFVYDTASRAESARLPIVATPDSPDLTVDSLTFDHRQLLAGIGGGLWAWDLGSGAGRQLVGSVCDSLRVDVRLQQVNCADASGHVSLMDLRQGKLIADETLSQTGNAVAAGTSADGTLVYGLTGSGEIIVWEPAHDQILGRLQLPDDGDEISWQSLDTAADGTTLLAISADAAGSTAYIITVRR